MAVNDKIQIFPSRANAVLMSQKILAAKRGIRLLMRKRDAIDMKLRELKAQMVAKGDKLDDVMRNAIFSVTKANLLGADFKPLTVTDQKKATTYLLRRQQKIVGVTLNYFDLEISDMNAQPLVGLNCGGQQVAKVRTNFQDALNLIVEYASLEYMLRLLMYASHQTNMRVNALDFVVLPQLSATAKYISSELEEFEREDFYRLKRSQAKQLEAKRAFTELIKTKNMTPEELAAYIKHGGHVQHLPEITFDEAPFEREAPDPKLREAYIKRHSLVATQTKRADTHLPDPHTAEYFKHIDRTEVRLSEHAQSLVPQYSSSESSNEDS
ncbi:V-type proton ATPase subunit D 1 [Drosophila mojavensis]|uniref:Uncharacterized protein n=1 Tax=Drosophila mojavensis TaxID=7230 RepID=B4KS09_DROMO|nr:V-type proton ATPase subunit D 1 [Drosophila mojavensis]EDW10445.1 uncharacterized protein Dmoj_GI18533 [Drosophila mojavensis]